MADPTASAGSVLHDGAEVSYQIEGPPRAPVLVLVSSLGTTMALWDAQMSALSAYFRVLRFDLPGHGRSSAPPGPYSVEQLGANLVALLDALSVDRASCCGVSLGGIIGMWLAAHHPERVDRLVLAATAPVLGPASAWTDRAATVRHQGTAVLVDSLVLRWFTADYREREQAVVAAVAEMITSCDAEGYAGCCEAIATMDQRASLADITAPTLVVAGSHDPVVPPSAGLELAEAVPGATFCALPDAAHLVNLVRPDRFGDLLVEHLAGSARERGIAVRRAVLGDAHVDRVSAAASPVSARFQDLITRYAWGDIWARPGLDRRTRSGVTIAILVALGRFDELEFHLRAALRNGLTADEICEVLLQSAVYAGVPAARSAFALAERLLRPDS